MSGRPGILITGIGIVSAAGTSLEENARALREGTPGLGSLSRFSSPRCGHFPVAEVSTAGDERTPRTRRLAQLALSQALADAGLDAPPPDAGLVLGTSTAGLAETESWMHAGADEAGAQVLQHHECGAVTDALADRFDITGPATTISAACSSSAQALATAAEFLRFGRADCVLAGGADALCRLTLNGFASLLNMSAVGCRPFDANRDGMSLGEGAAFLVLERSDRRTTNRPALAELAGTGNSCDAFHPTAPEPEGRGAEAAMASALADAGVHPDEVDYVNAHGTGTVENDRAEGRAIHRLFTGRNVDVSSTKAIFGHTLGAAGAIEAVASVLAMQGGFRPGNPRLESPDPECAVTPLTETSERPPHVILSNSFAFGGNNSSICLRAVTT